MKQITLTDSDFEWLHSKMRQFKKHLYANASQFDIEVSERIMRLNEEFEAAASDKPKIKKETKAEEPTPKAAVTKRKPRGEKPVLSRHACQEHPKYTATRVPRSECEGCWAFYKALHPTTYPMAVRKFQLQQKRKARG